MARCQLESMLHCSHFNRINRESMMILTASERSIMQFYSLVLERTSGLEDIGSSRTVTAKVMGKAASCG